MNDFCKASTFFKVSIADIEQLIRVAPANFNPNMKVNGKTLLYWVASRGKMELFIHLWKLGADLNLPNDDDSKILGSQHAGKTPLYGALYYNHKNIVRFMLTDPNIKNEVIIDQSIWELVKQSKRYGHDIRSLLRYLNSINEPNIAENSSIPSPA